MKAFKLWSLAYRTGFVEKSLFLFAHDKLLKTLIPSLGLLVVKKG